jgi:hypothetical protein
MADLETAAAESLAAARSLDQKAAEATHHLRDLRGSVEAIDHQCDGTWNDFEQRIDGFDAELKLLTEALDQAGQEARHALDAARAQVEGHAPLVEQLLLDAAQHTDALREHVQQAETEVMPLVDDLETVVRAAIDAAHKAKTELEAAVNEARTFMVDEVVDALHHMQDAVRTHTAEWRTHLDQQQVQPAHHDETDWGNKLGEVERTVEEAFAGAAQHATEVAAFVGEKLKAACDDALAELSALTAPAAKELGELKAKADDARGDAAHADDDLEQEVHDTIDVLDDAAGHLFDIAVELAKFTFTGL